MTEILALSKESFEIELSCKHHHKDKPNHEHSQKTSIEGPKIKIKGRSQDNNELRFQQADLNIFTGKAVKYFKPSLDVMS